MQVQVNAAELERCAVECRAVAGLWVYRLVVKSGTLGAGWYVRVPGERYGSYRVYGTFRNEWAALRFGSAKLAEQAE